MRVGLPHCHRQRPWVREKEGESAGVGSGFPGRFWTCTVQHQAKRQNGVQHVCGSKAWGTIQGHVPGELSLSLSLCLWLFLSLCVSPSMSPSLSCYLSLFQCLSILLSLLLTCPFLTLMPLCLNGDISVIKYVVIIRSYIRGNGHSGSYQNSFNSINPHTWTPIIQWHKIPNELCMH